MLWDDNLRAMYDEANGQLMSFKEANEKGRECLAKMNEDQESAFFRIINAFNTRKKLFFLQVRVFVYSTFP